MLLIALIPFQTIYACCEFGVLWHIFWAQKLRSQIFFWQITCMFAGIFGFCMFVFWTLFFCIDWYRSADHHQEQEWPAVIHCNFLASTGALWLWTTMQQMQRCLAIDRCDTWLLVTCFFWLFAMLNTFFSCSQSVQYLILLSLGSQSVHYLSLVTCV